MWFNASPRWMVNRFSGVEFDHLVTNRAGRDVKALIQHPDISFWDAVGRFSGIRDGTVKHLPDPLGAWEDDVVRLEAEVSTKFTLDGLVLRKSTSNTGPVRPSRSVAPARRRASPGSTRSRRRVGSADRYR